MIHYTCDRCKRAIDPEDELRYAVHMEVRAVFGSGECLGNEEESDHLLELHEILERLEDSESSEVGEEIYQRQRYDLCSECHQQFVRNPMGRDMPLSIDFSAN